MDYEENDFLNRRYSILSPNSTRKLRGYVVVPGAYFPIPKTEDYQRGFIIRAFTKLISDENSSIIEVDEGQVFSLKQNIFYKTVVLNWRLTGSKYNILDESGGEIEGVSEYNGIQRAHANRILPGVVDKLYDLLQFYRLT
jgi:hypothetical protein